MTIRQDKRTGIYKAHIKTTTGQRQFTTKTTSLKEAKAVVKQSGLQELETKARANALTHKAVAQILSGDRTVTVEGCVPDWLDWMVHRGKSPRTIENLDLLFKAWVREKEIGKLHPSAIKDGHVATWVNAEDDAAKAGSRRVRIAVIRSFFTWALAKGHVLTDPTIGIGVDYRVLSHQQKEPKRVGVLTDEEVTKMVRFFQMMIEEREAVAKEALDRYNATPDTPAHRGDRARLKEDVLKAEAKVRRAKFWKLATIIGRWTGLRFGDICCLEWDSLADPDHLVVWTRKRDRRVKLDRRPRILADALKSIEKRDDRWVFPEEQAEINDIRLRSGMSHAFARFCERVINKDVSFHSLRHAYVTDCEARGIPMEHIRTDVGHMNARTTWGYVGD